MKCVIWMPRAARLLIGRAEQLASTMSPMLNGVECPCGYMCGDDVDDDEDKAPVAILRCEHCSNLERNACLGFHAFLTDTGSEEDLFSKDDHATYFANVAVENATRPVNLITANGSVQGNKAINIDLPELMQPVECYLLESKPPVCPVGRRCLDRRLWFPLAPDRHNTSTRQRVRRYSVNLRVVFQSSPMTKW